MSSIRIEYELMRTEPMAVPSSFVWRGMCFE